MASIRVPQLREPVYYINGDSFLGCIKEVEMPEIEYEYVEHEAVGLRGVVELFRNINPMECTVTHYYDRALISHFINPAKAFNLQVRGSIETLLQSGITSESLEIFMKCRSKGFTSGDFVQNENVEAEAKLAVDAYKLLIGGQTVFDIDILSNKFDVGGQDIFQQLLGLVSGLLGV